MTKSGRQVVPPQVYSDDDGDSQYASLSQMEETTEDEQEIAPQQFQLDLESNNGRHNNKNQHRNKHTVAKRGLAHPRSVSRSTSSSVDDKHQVIQRQPTRRPDPHIFNRNALMARENRIKKKQHLESLEQDVDALKQENDALRQLLRKRSTMVCKLRDDRLYLKSIIANKTSIMSLLKTIQGNRIPITSSAMSFVTEESSLPAAAAATASSGYAQHDDEDYEADGRVMTNAAADPMLTTGLTTRIVSFTDFQEANHTFPIHHSHSSSSSGCSPASSSSGHSVCTEMALDTWESLLNDDFGSDGAFFMPQLSDDDDDDAEDQPMEVEDGQRAQPPPPATRNCQSNVSHEHNYSNNHIIKQTTVESSLSSSSDGQRQRRNHPASSRGKTGPSTNAVDDQPGICLHLAGGRVSLEFCGSCHRHSMDAWDEEL